MSDRNVAGRGHDFPTTQTKITVRDTVGHGIKVEDRRQHAATTTRGLGCRRWGVLVATLPYLPSLNRTHRLPRVLQSSMVVNKRTAILQHYCNQSKKRSDAQNGSFGQRGSRSFYCWNKHSKHKIYIFLDLSTTRHANSSSFFLKTN